MGGRSGRAAAATKKPGGSGGEERWSWPISRVLSWAAIHLGRWSPIASSSLPAGSASSFNACLFGFAPSGVYLAVRVATSAVSSYLAISTLPDRVLRPAIGGIFSVALSVALGLSTYSAQALPGTLPCGARTFLYAANRAAAAWPTPARSIGGWQVKSGFLGVGVLR